MIFWDSSALVPLRAAAFVAAEHDPTSLDFVSLDDRHVEAASREGFRVIQL